MTKDVEFHDFVVERDGDKNLKFNGRIVAAVSSSPDRGRWVELNLYKTKSGSWVCEQIGHSSWQDEVTQHKAAVIPEDNLSEVFDFFGCGWLAKELYEEADIECVQEID